MAKEDVLIAIDAEAVEAARAAALPEAHLLLLVETFQALAWWTITMWLPSSKRPTTTSIMCGKDSPIIPIFRAAHGFRVSAAQASRPARLFFPGRTR